MSENLEDLPADGQAAVDLELDHILAGEAGWRGKSQDDSLVKVLAIHRIPQLANSGLARFWRSSSQGK